MKVCSVSNYFSPYKIKLFNEIGPKFANRNGGYTSALKLGNRKGDNAEVVLVRWVD